MFDIRRKSVVSHSESLGPGNILEIVLITTTAGKICDLGVFSIMPNKFNNVRKRKLLLYIAIKKARDLLFYIVIPSI